MSRDIVEVSIRRCFSARSSGSFYEPEEGSYLSCCSIAPVDVAHRRRCHRRGGPGPRHRLLFGSWTGQRNLVARAFERGSVSGSVLSEPELIPEQPNRSTEPSVSEQ